MRRTCWVLLPGVFRGKSRSEREEAQGIRSKKPPSTSTPGSGEGYDPARPGMAPLPKKLDPSRYSSKIGNFFGDHGVKAPFNPDAAGPFGGAPLQDNRTWDDAPQRGQRDIPGEVMNPAKREAREREERIRPPETPIQPQRGAPGHTPYTESDQAKMERFLQEEHAERDARREKREAESSSFREGSTKAERESPGYQKQSRAANAEENLKRSIGAQRNFVFQLKQNGAELWQIAEAEMQMFDCMLDSTRTRDAIEVMRKGEELFNKFERNEIPLPSNHAQLPSALAEMLAVAAAMTKEPTKVAFFERKARALKSTQYSKFAFIPDENNTMGYAPRTTKEVPIDGDENNTKTMHTRKTGAFFFDRQGRQQRLFSNQHPYFERGWAKEKFGSGWEEGPRFPR